MSGRIEAPGDAVTFGPSEPVYTLFATMPLQDALCFAARPSATLWTAARPENWGDADTKLAPPKVLLRA
jgi:hypothetical protein